MAKKNNFIKEMLKDAAELRKGVFEFQGFDREFLLFQQQLLNDYEKSSGLKHPVNRGDAREDYLRNFFRAYGLIPQKYGISSTSSRVVSNTGRHSEEIDILFFDWINNISLLKYQNTEFYPIEFVYGVVQVKSYLRNKKAVKDGLRNIASFKKLTAPKPINTRMNRQTLHGSAKRGFGILFSYKSTLKWLTIISAIKEFMSDHPSSEWPNAVVILDEGVIIPFNGKCGYYRTSDIDRLNTPNVMGRPDRGHCLLNFYTILLDLLNTGVAGGFQLSKYLRLPLLSGEISYKFSYGPSAEIGSCEKHGQFLRGISQDALKKIIDTCDGIEPINWIKALDIAHGKPGDRHKAYQRQPGDLYIYNPDDAKLNEILIFPNEQDGLAYDSIIIEEKTYWIPYIYSLRDNLVTIQCPKCKKA